MNRQDFARRTTRSGREFSAFGMEFTQTSIVQLATRAANATEAEQDALDTVDSRSVTDVTIDPPFSSSSVPPVPPSLVTPVAPSLKRRRDETDDAAELPEAPPTALSKSSQRQKDRRRAKRRAERAENPRELKEVVERRVCATKRVKLEFEASAATEPVALTGYVCLPDIRLNKRRKLAAKAEEVKPVYLPERRAYSADELLGMGFTKKEWKGDTIETILSSEGYPLVHLCGQPRDTTGSNWQQDVVEPATTLLHKASAALYQEAPFQGVYYGKRSDSKKPNVRRGTHRAETIGIGMGGGQTQPAEFINDAIQAAIVRIIGFTNAMFRTCAGGLHSYYASTMDKLHSHLRHLPRLFPAALSVFASLTLNLGPQTATLPHIDLLNLAWGLCFITRPGPTTPFQYLPPTRRDPLFGHPILRRRSFPLRRQRVSAPGPRHGRDDHGGDGITGTGKYVALYGGAADVHSIRIIELLRIVITCRYLRSEQFHSKVGRPVSPSSECVTGKGSPRARTTCIWPTTAARTANSAPAVIPVEDGLKKACLLAICCAIRRGEDWEAPPGREASVLEVEVWGIAVQKPGLVDGQFEACMFDEECWQWRDLAEHPSCLFASVSLLTLGCTYALSAGS
ncbi:hypothetical protein C8F01DRAFT_1085719 [Mycena amicta]|nr:hypothetical protein C8F01DRAFT_1085719 [Mycena amicta]